MGLRGQIPDDDEKRWRTERKPKGYNALKTLKKSPRPPKDLDEEAKGLWRRLAPLLVRERLLNGLNLPAFEALCLAYSRAKRADAVLLERGFCYTDAHGRTQPSPENQVAVRSWASFRSFCDAFGLTPVAQRRLGYQPGLEKAKPNKLADVLQQIGNR